MNHSTFSCVDRRYAVVLAALLGPFIGLDPCRAQGTLTITFDGAPIQPPNSSYAITNYAERGARFVGYFDRTGSGSTNRPDNGTTYIQPTSPPVICSRVDGLSFRLVSVDLAGYSVVLPDYDASFEGHRSDGSVVSTNIAVSGMGFQTCYFPSEFSDLTNIVIRAGSLDNLTMQVPSIPPVLSMGAYHYRGDSWVTLDAQGTVGLQYRLEYTDTLPATNWLTFTNFESRFGWIEYVSRDMPPRRFFRALEVP